MLHRHHSVHASILKVTLALIGLAAWMARPVSVAAVSSAPTALVEPRYSPTPQAHGELNLEERVAYERAIQEVYWRHRIWPKENLHPKPALDQVMPLSALRAKVEDYLGKSQALEVYWQRPITGAQLQAEMDRMARQTKQPQMLKELWAGLGDDPYLIAECLARPALANRLVRNWYAYDQRYHGALKRRAEAELGAYGTPSQMRAMSGEYRELNWAKGESQAADVGAVAARRSAPAAEQNTVTFNSDEWAERVRQLAQLFGAPHPQPFSSRGERGESLFELSSISPFGGEGGPQGPGEGVKPADVRAEMDLLPLNQLSRLQEDSERFYVVAVLEKGNEQLKVATVEWEKEPFDTWWGRVRDQMQLQPSPFTLHLFHAPEYAYRLAPIASVSGSCADDTWTLTLPPLVSARAAPAVWTGSSGVGSLVVPSSSAPAGATIQRPTPGRQLVRPMPPAHDPITPRSGLAMK